MQNGTFLRHALLQFTYFMSCFQPQIQALCSSEGTCCIRNKIPKCSESAGSSCMQMWQIGRASAHATPFSAAGLHAVRRSILQPQNSLNQRQSLLQHRRPCAVALAPCHAQSSPRWTTATTLPSSCRFSILATALFQCLESLTAHAGLLHFKLIGCLWNIWY